MMRLVRSQLRYILPMQFNFLRIKSPNSEFYSTDSGHFLDDEKQPRKPKKPTGAFFMFLKDINPQLKKEHPQARGKELVSLTGKIWRNDDNVRTKYMDMYYKNMEEYQKAFQQYQSSLPSGHKEPEQSKESIKTTFRKKMKDLGKPKKPPAAYSIFLTSRRGSKRASESRMEWFQKLVEEWKNMPEKHKEKYFVKAQELEQAYNDNLRTWLLEVLEHDGPEYKPVQKMILKSVKKTFLNVKEESRRSLVQKPRKPTLSKEAQLIVDMIPLFEK